MRKMIVLLALVCALGVVGGAGAATTTTTTVQVKAGEFFFKLSKTSIAKPGTVVFTVKNAGHLAHDFKIAGKKTALIQPGKSATLKVKFAKAGKYAYLCTVPGHASAGMKGRFTVR
ncbi:MAG: plastocyanin/azurin family copper-binding protein [Gaiellaceae bacterium]